MRAVPPETAWWQITIDFPDPTMAEHTVAHHVAPTLEGLDWFFIRKGGWRCRIRRPGDTAQTVLRTRLAGHLDALVDSGYIGGWTRGVYEPESRAFGGREAMEVAHTLWCDDTHHLMAFLTADFGEPDGRRELALLLCRTLLKAAGLDRYEQGDVWDRVAATRSPPTDTPTPPVFHQRMQRLLSVDPGPEAAHFATGAFAPHIDRARAFHVCGHALANLNAQGGLERGLRAVVAHHVLFAWNRLGIPEPVQAVLAHTAATVIFDPGKVGL